MYIDWFDWKKVFVFIYLGFMLGMFVCGLANDYYIFLVVWSIIGVFGGVFFVLVFFIIGDVVLFKWCGQVMGVVMIVFFVVFVVGVLVGFYLVVFFSWRAIFFVIGGIVVVVLVLIFFFILVFNWYLQGEGIQCNFFCVMGNIFKDGNQ